jgi:hypothetical protein
MPLFGPEIIFNAHEQQLGLPSRISHEDALHIGDALVTGAFRVQADALQQFRSRQARHVGFTDRHAAIELTPDISDQLLSLGAYQRYALGRQLMEFAAPEIANVVIADIRGQSEA